MNNHVFYFDDMSKSYTEKILSDTLFHDSTILLSFLVDGPHPTEQEKEAGARLRIAITFKFTEWYERERYKYRLEVSSNDSCLFFGSADDKKLEFANKSGFRICQGKKQTLLLDIIIEALMLSNQLKPLVWDIVSNSATAFELLAVYHTLSKQLYDDKSSADFFREFIERLMILFNLRDKAEFDKFVRFRFDELATRMDEFQGISTFGQSYCHICNVHVWSDPVMNRIVREFPPLKIRNEISGRTLLFWLFGRIFYSSLQKFLVRIISQEILNYKPRDSVGG